jgi:hypothetical protein
MVRRFCDLVETLIDYLFDWEIYLLGEFFFFFMIDIYDNEVVFVRHHDWRSLDRPGRERTTRVVSLSTREFLLRDVIEGELVRVL